MLQALHYDVNSNGEKKYKKKKEVFISNKEYKSTFVFNELSILI